MKLMTCREASRHLADYGVTQSKIKRGCEAGKYPFLRVGNRILVDLDALMPIVEEEGRRLELLSTAELAMRIGLSESSIRKAVADGWMPCQIVGRNMRFDLEAVQDAVIERMSSKYSV